MKRLLLFVALLVASGAWAQNSLIQTNLIYTGVRPVNVENSGNVYKEVLAQQGGKSVEFDIDFSKTTYDSIRVNVRFTTNTAGTHNIKFENAGATILPIITSTGVVDTQLTSPWVYVGGQSTLQTFKLWAKASSATGDISIYYADYQLLANDGIGGSGSTETATIKEGGSTVGTGEDHAFDFGPGFDITEAPDDEFNIVLDYTEDPVDLSGAEVTSTLPGAKGGLGLSTYTVGDIVYVSSITPITFSRLAGVATGNALLSGGVGAGPAYGKIGLSTHVSGTLPGTSLNLHGAIGSADGDSLKANLGIQRYPWELEIGDVRTAAWDSSGNQYLKPQAAPSLGLGLMGIDSNYYATNRGAFLVYPDNSIAQALVGIPANDTPVTGDYPRFDGSTGKWTASQSLGWSVNDTEVAVGVGTDSADGYSTFQFTNNRLNIGGRTSPEFQLTMQQSSGTSDIGMRSYGAASKIWGGRANGTVGGETVVLSGETIFQLGAFGYDGSSGDGFSIMAVGFDFGATENWDASGIGSFGDAWAIPANSQTAADVFRWDTDRLYLYPGIDFEMEGTAGGGTMTIDGDLAFSGATNVNPPDNSGDWVVMPTTNGFPARTASRTFSSRTLQQPAAGLTITNPAGVAGDPTFALANDLAALEGLGSTGFATKTAADTWAQRTLQAPAAGFTITNPAGVAGDPTFVLANDLAALEGLSSTGIAVKTAADTWAQRTITGTPEEVTVTDGNGVSGNPVLSLPDVYEIRELPAGYFNPGAGDLTGATSLADADDNTNDWTVDMLEFSASAENYVSAHIVMPLDWDGSTAPKFKLVYFSSTGHGSNTVDWNIQCGYIRHGTDSWVGALGAAASTFHNPTTADILYETSALQPTPAGTAAVGASLKIRVWRDGDDATNDTHTATAKLVKVLMLYKKTIYGETTDW